MITIIDYKICNLASVANALTKLEIPFKISSNPDAIKKAQALILPGVGAAGQAMQNLKTLNLIQPIITQTQKGTPILGICLGMQLLLSYSEEGNVNCLNLIQGNVKKLNTNLKVPQIGWNQVRIKNHELRITENIPDNTNFYFVNSYICAPDDQSITIATTKYESEFCSILQKKNIIGTQFHPEKSGSHGLQLLQNFYNLI